MLFTNQKNICCAMLAALLALGGLLANHAKADSKCKITLKVNNQKEHGFTITNVTLQQSILRRTITNKFTLGRKIGANAEVQVLTTYSIYSKDDKLCRKAKLLIQASCLVNGQTVTKTFTKTAKRTTSKNKTRSLTLKLKKKSWKECK